MFPLWKRGERRLFRLFVLKFALMSSLPLSLTDKAGVRVKCRYQQVFPHPQSPWEGGVQNATIFAKLCTEFQINFAQLRIPAIRKPGAWY